MTQKKLSTLFLTIVFLLVISFLERNNPRLSLDKLLPITPTISQNHTVLGSTDSAKLRQVVRVKKVIDGDTLEIEGGQTIRYIGIDTPETRHPTKGVQCFGKEASAKNKELVEGKEITIEKDVSETDRYGRFLRYVYVSDPSTSSGQLLFINDYLVRQGYAVASTFPPDVKYQEQFRQAENEARSNNRGLWSSCK